MTQSLLPLLLLSCLATTLFCRCAEKKNLFVEGKKKRFGRTYLIHFIQAYNLISVLYTQYCAKVLRCPSFLYILLEKWKMHAVINWNINHFSNTVYWANRTFSVLMSFKVNTILYKPIMAEGWKMKSVTVTGWSPNGITWSIHISISFDKTPNTSGWNEFMNLWLWLWRSQISSSVQHHLCQSYLYL